MTAPTGARAHTGDVVARDAVDLAVELLRKVSAGDAHAAQAMLTQLTRGRLENLAVVLAHLVDREATLPQLVGRGRPPGLVHVVELVAGVGCDPSLWGPSVTSRAVHGTRSRYGAGCRGALCVQAERDYQRARRRNPGHAAASHKPAQAGTP